VTAALVVLALLGLWELVARLSSGTDLLLAAPTEVARALWLDREPLLTDLAVTAGEVVAGLAVAVLAGAALALAMHLSAPLRRALGPLVVGSQAVPVPVVAPLFVLVLGFGLAPKILVVALVCFFPVTINLLDGLRAADSEATKLLRVLGASRWARLRLVELPAALPAAFTGIRIAAAVAVIGAVFAEWSGADQGLGHGLIAANAQLESARVFAIITLLFALAVGLYGLFALLERRIVDWRA